MTTITLLGLVAGTFTTLAFLPQVIRVWRRRSASDLSFLTLAVFVSGVALWVVYAWQISDIPMLLANAVTLVLTATLCGFKIYFR